MSRFQTIALTLLYILMLLSCNKIEVENDDASVIFAGDDFSWAESEGVKNALKRASQLALVNWIPLASIPWNYGSFKAGMPFVGVPYSSTKQINKYIGLDVSLHTFMTAVNNPYSVLYTENISKPPYNGSNCATYYGTVCSAYIDYVLGLGAPFPANFIVNLPEFERNPIQTLEFLKPGDVIHVPGHIFMIYKTIKESGLVTEVYYVEASSYSCHLDHVTADIFQERVNREGCVSYRYCCFEKVPIYSPSPYVSIGTEEKHFFSFNSFLCPNRGDESVYRTNEEVIINVLNNNVGTIIVENQIGEQSLFEASTNTILGYLPEGKYSAYFTNGNAYSETVHFIVANPQIQMDNGNPLRVYFSCGDFPALYCVICDCQGDYRAIKMIKDNDREKGYIDVDLPAFSDNYCKVVFQTPYGTVINNPLLIDYKLPIGSI